MKLLVTLIPHPSPSIPSLSSLQAIEFLSRVEPFHAHAVHFAIALQEINLLHLTESTRSKLCTFHPIFPPLLLALSLSLHVVVKDPDGVYRLNFARLVIGYTRRFSQTDPREALQYFFLLKVCMYTALNIPAQFHFSLPGDGGRRGTGCVLCMCG